MTNPIYSIIIVTLNKEVSMKKLDGLSVFFPAYNEEDNIETVVRKALNVLPSFAEEFEIIVVDDGSTDRTAEFARTIAHKDRRVHLVLHGSNRGYGAALKTGFRSAKYDNIFFTDGDGQFDIKELDRLIPLYHKCDIAAGYRIKRNDPPHRVINGKAYNFLVRLLFGLRVRDIDCAFKLIRKKVVDSIELRSNAAFISAELLIRSGKAGFRIEQTGVNHFSREKGSSTGNNPLVVIRSFRELFKLRKELA
jgi:glycosyltransferase involved in cell wall biosynthesis